MLSLLLGVETSTTTLEILTFSQKSRNSATSITSHTTLAARGRQHLEDVPETWDRGGSEESMGVTLAKTYSNKDMEHEKATSCSQAETTVE